MEDNKNLIQSVEGLGYDYNKLNNNIKNNIWKIYKYRREVIEGIELSQLDIQKDFFSVTKIADKLECSRTTIYNNEVVRDYITSLKEELDELNPYLKIKSLEEKVDDLNEKIDLMKLRDVDLEILRIENRELKEHLNNDKSKKIYNINNE